MWVVGNGDAGQVCTEVHCFVFKVTSRRILLYREYEHNTPHSFLFPAAVIKKTLVNARELMVLLNEQYWAQFISPPCGTANNVVEYFIFKAIKYSPQGLWIRGLASILSLNLPWWIVIFACKITQWIESAFQILAVTTREGKKHEGEGFFVPVTRIFSTNFFYDSKWKEYCAVTCTLVILY